jgi:hypothetical protein
MGAFPVTTTKLSAIGRALRIAEESDDSGIAEAIAEHYRAFRTHSPGADPADSLRYVLATARAIVKELAAELKAIDA